jgi:hypothetical protein
MIITSVLSSCVKSSGRFMKDAVHEGCFLLSQVGYSDNKKFAWLRYWPSYLSGSIAIASTVAAVAFSLIHNIPNAIFHGAIALSSLILAGTLHIFIPLKQLEKQTADLQERNKELSGVVNRVESSEQAFRQLNLELSSQLEIRKRTNEDLESNIRLHLHGLEEITNKLIASEKKAKSLEELLHVIQRTSEGFQSQVTRFEAIRQDVSHSEQEFNRATGSLIGVAAGLKDQIQDLQQQHTVIEGEYQTALQFADGLQQIFLEIQNIYQKIKEEVDQLKLEVVRLSKNTQVAQQSSTDLSHTVDELEQALRLAHEQDPFIKPATVN